MAEAELDHLVCNVAMLRHHLCQHAAIAIFALISVLDAGRAHETLKLLGSAIRKRSLLTATSAFASFWCVIPDDPVLNAVPPECVSIDDAGCPLARSADRPLVLCCRG